jgi:hypothetical protein
MILPASPKNYGLGDLNCPGDPGCPGNPAGTGDNNPLAAPLSPYSIAALSNYNAAYFGSPSSIPGANPIASWLSTNPKAVWWSLAAVVGLAFLSEGRR